MVVFDASTLILLAKTNLLGILLDSYKGVIVIPRAVHAEALAQAQE